MGLLYGLVFVLGACFGSFLNVVVYRLPAGLSLSHPPSRCPHCLHPLGATENVPILGWLWLGGRCRWCGVSIAWRYPLVEALTGGLFVAVFGVFGWQWQSLAYCGFLFWLLALTLIDFDTMTIPNALTQSGLVAGLMAQTFLGWQGGGSTMAMDSLFRAIAAMVLGIWLFDAIAMVGSVVFGQPAMGGGDPKLVAMVGAWLGWQLMILGGFLACALGALVGGGAIALGLLKRQQPIPFGPFLAAGAALSLFFGESWLTWYGHRFLGF